MTGVAPALVLRSAAGEELYRRDVEHLRSSDLQRLLTDLGYHLRSATAVAEQETAGGALQAATLGLARKRSSLAAASAPPSNTTAVALTGPQSAANATAAGAAVAALGGNQEALKVLLEPMKLVQHASPPPAPAQGVMAAGGRPRRASLPPGAGGAQGVGVAKAVEKLRDGVYIPTLFSQTGAVDRAGNAAG